MCFWGVASKKLMKMASWLAGWLAGSRLGALAAGLPIGWAGPDTLLGLSIGPGLPASLLANCWVQSWAAYELAAIAD